MDIPRAPNGNPAAPPAKAHIATYILKICISQLFPEWLPKAPWNRPQNLLRKPWGTTRGLPCGDALVGYTPEATLQGDSFGGCCVVFCVVLCFVVLCCVVLCCVLCCVVPLGPTRPHQTLPDLTRPPDPTLPEPPRPYQTLRKPTRRCQTPPNRTRSYRSPPFSGGSRARRQQASTVSADPRALRRGSRRLLFKGSSRSSSDC